MSHFEHLQNNGEILPQENPRTVLKAAEGNEVREQLERQRLSREYRAVQMEIMEKRDSYNKGIQSIEVAVGEQNSQAKAFRERLIEVGRETNDEIKALEIKASELKSAIEAMGGDVSSDTIH